MNGVNGRIAIGGGSVLPRTKDVNLEYKSISDTLPADRPSKWHIYLRESAKRSLEHHRGYVSQLCLLRVFSISGDPNHEVNLKQVEAGPLPAVSLALSKS